MSITGGKKLFNLVEVALSPLEKKVQPQISQVPPRMAQVPRKTDPHVVRKRSFGTFQRPLLSGVTSLFVFSPVYM